MTEGLDEESGTVSIKSSEVKLSGSCSGKEIARYWRKSPKELRADVKIVLTREERDGEGEACTGSGGIGGGCKGGGSAAGGSGSISR